MKRALLCVPDPWNYYDQLNDYSLMTVNPDNTPTRQKYLVDNSDWSLKITVSGEEYRDGGSYPGERVFGYTSGTTGDSKFYSFTQAQIDHCVATMCAAYDISANDRYVGVMPLWHAHGQAWYWAAKRVGCEMNFVSVTNIRNMPAYSPTFISAVPDILKTVLRMDFDSLRFIRSASSALPNWLYSDLSAKFQVPIIEAFGMTEAYSHCLTNPLHGERRMGTVGLPSGVEARIENGHLMIRGPSVIVDDWFDTGDLAQQDDAGYYCILGRSVDQLNIKGKKFNPISLESQLLNHIPSLKEVVIFGNTELNCLYVGECQQDQIKNFLLTLDRQLKPTLLNKVESIPTVYPGKISRSFLTRYYNCQ